MTVKAVSDSWHMAASQAKMQKEKDYGKITWQPVFGKKELEIPQSVSGEEGWKLVSLTDTEELKKEGKDLDHCVGGYTHDCNEKNSHIVSIRNPQGEAVSTIEFKTDYESKSSTIAQHYGVKNSEPSKESKDIERAILKKLNRKEPDDKNVFGKFVSQIKKAFKKSNETGNSDWDNLSIDYESLEQARNERKKLVRSPREKLKSQLGFDPLDDKKLRKIQDVYSSIVAPKGAHVKDANGQEIENFSTEIRSGLRKRFQKLRTAEINIDPEQIGGKSKFSSPELEKKAPDKAKKKKSFSEEYLQESVQSSINNIFPEYKAGSINVGIDKSNNSEYGEIVLAMPDSTDVDKIKGKLEQVFQSEQRITIEKSKNEEGSSLQICGMTPKPVSQILEGHLKRHSQGTAIQM